MMKKIEWNGFLKHCVDEYPKEACAFLFSSKPYSDEEYWVVYKVKNISSYPEESWIPDPKEMNLIKKLAIERGLVKIGNIHTHPYPKDEEFSEEVLQYVLEPSELDLKFARKHNDVVRGIMVVNKDGICDIRFHDKFGNDLRIKVVEEDVQV